MIARIKGLKISQASERTAVTGQEMIPFQDGERNGKIRMIEFKDMTMYIFDPTIVDGKVSQEDYDALKQAIEEGKLIYTINSNRNGLDLATEVAIVGGTIYIESPDFIKEEGTDNISQVVFDTITVDGSLNYSKEQYTTTVIKTTGDGTKVLTDNGQYVYIGNLALTNIKFKDGTNTSTYDLVTNGITFRQNATPCVSWNTVKSGNNIYMDIRIANATASMDGLMSKEDYVELNTTIPGQIEDLKEADSNLNNRIDDLDDKIDKEIADREAEIDRIENKFDGVTDELEAALQKEIEDRKAGDTTITNNLNAFISTKGQPGGLAELDSTGKVPAAQLPSYVDDVLEYSTKAQFPQTGETGKIYVAKDTNLTYRWTGTQYLEISQSLALGETPSTAYPGDKGKATTDKLNKTSNKVVVGPVTVNPSTDKVVLKYQTHFTSTNSDSEDSHTINAATTSQAGVMTSADKTKLNGLKDQAGITSDIDAVQTNLETHINNKSNPHEVTKDQVGLGNVDNTSDANKPISTATQNALNDKFSATEGNNLKQIVIDMPDLVVTEGSLRHNSDSISLNLIKQNLKNPDDTGSSLLKFDPVTDSTAGIVLPSDKNKIDKIITNGDGTKFLTDNGQYKVVQGSNEYIDNAISSARSYGYMMQLTEIDASGLDENTWYPVTITAGIRMCMRAEVLVALDSGTKPSWSTHNRGFSTRKIWEWAPSTWGINAVSDIKVYLSDFAHAQLDPVRGLDFLSHFDMCYVFVRGGGKYYFYVSHSANVILHTDTYTALDQSVSPTTTAPEPINALDLKNYGKVIDVPNGSYLTLNVNRVGTDAIDYINKIFGQKKFLVFF